jgi:hypothetical protein
LDEIPKTIPIKDRDDPFIIEEVIGEGGMGKVYRAHDPVTNARLAVKVLGEVGDPTRFAVESDILSKLSHPNIVAYRGHGLTKDGHPYLAMEWIDGEDLEKHLETANLTVEETLRIARALADALGAAHAAGVIHRDLKPSNVILTRSQRVVKLVDFGIARAANVEGLTKTGQALGTPGYMSPEQARGNPVDARTDLFSLGCLIFRCVGGRRPFAGSDIMQFATSLALENPPPLREIAPLVPRDLEALVAQLLQKDPGLRPQSALHVKKALDRIVAGADRTELAPTADTPAAKTQPVAPARSDPALERTELAPSAVVTRRSEAESAPPKWAQRATFAMMALLVVGVVAKFAMQKAPPSHEEERPSAPVASVPSATPLPEPVDRAALDRACKQWAQALAKGQRADGSFAGEERATSSGWDTAQQLFALAEAHKACDGVLPATLAAGVKALDAEHVPGGWVGPRDSTSKDRTGESSASAWALLALDTLGETSAAKRARADLLAARNPDGGFRREAAKKEDSAPYPTMLAAAALTKTPEGDAARDWLARATLRQAPGLLELGFTEEIAWVYERAAGPDVALKRIFAKETIAHCRLDASGKCLRAPYDTGRAPLLPDGGAPLIALWHPWATLAAATLAKEPELGAEQKKDLEAIALWGKRELTASIDLLGAAPAYKLSEYLMAVSELLELR